MQYTLTAHSLWSIRNELLSGHCLPSNTGSRVKGQHPFKIVDWPRIHTDSIISANRLALAIPGPSCSVPMRCCSVYSMWTTKPQNKNGKHDGHGLCWHACQLTTRRLNKGKHSNHIHVSPSIHRDSARQRTHAYPWHRIENSAHFKSNRKRISNFTLIRLRNGSKLFLSKDCNCWCFLFKLANRVMSCAKIFYIKYIVNNWVHVYTSVMGDSLGWRCQAGYRTLTTSKSKTINPAIDEAFNRSLQCRPNKISLVTKEWWNR